MRFEHRAALFFAQARSGAEHAAGPSQNIVLFYGANGAGNVFKTQFADEFSRPGIRRASCRTRGIMAEQATIGFGQRLDEIKPFAHLLELFSIAHEISSFLLTLLTNTILQSKQAKSLDASDKIVNANISPLKRIRKIRRFHKRLDLSDG